MRLGMEILQMLQEERDGKASTDPEFYRIFHQMEELERRVGVMMEGPYRLVVLRNRQRHWQDVGQFETARFALMFQGDIRSHEIIDSRVVPVDESGGGEPPERVSVHKLHQLIRLMAEKKPAKHHRDVRTGPEYDKRKAATKWEKLMDEVFPNRRRSR